MKTDTNKEYNTVILKYNKKEKIIELTTKGHIDENATHDVLVRITEIASSKPLRGIYLDLSTGTSFSSQAIDRAMGEKSEHPLVAMAVVGASSILRILVNYLGFVGGYDVRFFKTTSEACEWLKQFNVRNEQFIEAKALNIK